MINRERNSSKLFSLYEIYREGFKGPSRASSLISSNNNKKLSFSFFNNEKNTFHTVPVITPAVNWWVSIKPAGLLTREDPGGPG